MNKAERAKNILEILDRIYPDPPIPLDHKNGKELDAAGSICAAGSCAHITLSCGQN